MATANQGKQLSKRDMIQQLVDSSGLDKKQVMAVVDGLRNIMVEQLRSSGVFVLPGTIKLRVMRKGPSKERISTNPATKAPMTIPAKPARQVLKATALKPLVKEAISQAAEPSTK